MPLRINIPNEHKKKGNIETDKDPLKINLNSSNELSKKRVKRRDKKRGETFAEFSVKDEDAFPKKRGKKRRVTSPVLPVKGASPPTEVAKWAPSCISHHTKPYYEAWVDTTLAAISSGSNRDKLFFDKQRFIQSFQRALYERTELPDLTYENCNDERYTGRIKVSQR
ncbi:Fad-dependent amine oxidoreductase [Operophtera brumata]|uniref:Fad-dependent amine oxidoreductase n=1 Tax=Operophtera brumata TaxID=104452 RepID=A0A0L7L5C5_OPEBR|nr:Fad-dependent amine oxidoreductase [Operophtera brumata]